MDMDEEEDNENILEYDEDANEFYDEDGLPINNPYGDELYYDELDDEDDFYYDDLDGIQANSSSSSSSSSESDENDDLAGAPGKDVEIAVEITEKKNDIIEMPIDEEQIHHDMVHRKVDNDMESSDLGFSDHLREPDEHDYQIAELGEFEVDRSLSDVLEGINKDKSVEFSQEFDSDLSRVSGHDAHLDEKEYSYM